MPTEIELLDIQDVTDSIANGNFQEAADKVKALNIEPALFFREVDRYERDEDYRFGLDYEDVAIVTELAGKD